MILNLIKSIARISAFALIACNSVEKGSQLSPKTTEYISSLGLLDDDEEIILFESHSGMFWKSWKKSGNFISTKRLATYWLEDNSEDKSSLKFAYYTDIDTLIFNNLSDIDWTAASYISIRQKDSNSFRLFVSGNYQTVESFFKEAERQWRTLTFTD